MKKLMLFAVAALAAVCFTTGCVSVDRRHAVIITPAPAPVTNDRSEVHTY